MRPVLTLIVAILLVAPGCTRPRQYELQGQVLAVDRSRLEITIKHGDIRGFMPGMTMPFKVRDARLLDGRTAGDLVTATLVVQDGDAFLSAVERTGHAPLTEAVPGPRMDLLAPGERAPDVVMIDEAGEARMLSAWRGRTLAVTFIYTRCPLPDFCPRMDQHFAAIQRDVLADARLRERVTLLSVSFDPLFDTPQVLGAHARRAGADPRVWRFVTGERDAIRAFALRFGVSTMGEEAEAKEITHNLRTAVVGADGTIVHIFTGNQWTPAELLDALRRASA
jgi:protein SCO1/2